MAATCPTRSRSTSCLTSTDRQYSHTVCTASDHLNWIGAPQFGQLAVFIVVRPPNPPHVHCRRTEASTKRGFKVPIRPLPAAEKIQARRPVLGEGMTGEVRFGKESHSG